MNVRAFKELPVFATGTKTVAVGHFVWVITTYIRY